MKICFVNSFYPPYIGGAERYVSSIAQELAKRGHDVTVYCSERPLKAGEGQQEGVRVVRMRTPLMLYGTPIAAFPPRFFTERYDLIHANFPSPYFAGASSFGSLLKKIPSVLTWHNDLPPVSSGAKMLVGLHDLLSYAYLGHFQRIIATTEAYARRSRTLMRYREKVSVIPNGVDTKKFEPSVSGDSIRDKYGLRGKVVLFVGALTRWHRYKGLDVLLRAFGMVRKKLEDAELLVVGEGEMKGVYVRLAVELGIADSVVFTGEVSEPMLPAYYAASDILVLPSRDSSEGFGIVLLEAMATGKAVVGTRVGGIVDVIKDGERGAIVEANDTEGMAETIVKMLTDDEMRVRLGANGRAFAESRDWGKIAERVEQTYHELLYPYESKSDYSAHALTLI